MILSFPVKFSSEIFMAFRKNVWKGLPNSDIFHGEWHCESIYYTFE